LLRGHTFLWSLSGIIASASIGLGVDLMSDGHTWLGVGILVAGVLVSLVIAYYGYVQYKRQKSNTQIITVAKKARAKKAENYIPDLLWQLHNRMLKFVEIRTKQDITEVKLNKVMEMTCLVIVCVSLSTTRSISNSPNLAAQLSTPKP
jgi:hypothetical protein